MGFPLEISEAVLRTAQGLLKELTPEQRVWMSGYFAGAAAAGGADMAAVHASDSAPVHDGPAVPVFFATDTGNARKLAEALAARLRAAGYRVALQDLASIKPRRLESAPVALFIASTHGEGDPPERARPFMAALDGRHPPKLTNTLYSVLALGDSSYKRYCEAGRRLDARLADLGAERLHPRVECDVDFMATAEGWMRAVVEELARRVPAAAPASAPRVSVGGFSAPSAPAHDRSRPFAAEVLENTLLTDEGSTKQTRHLEILIEGSGLSYAPGDALGIFPANDPAEADALIEALGLDPESPVPCGEGAEKPLREALISDYEITRLVPPVVRSYAEHTRDGLHATLLAPGGEDALWSYIEGRGLLDLVRDYPPPRPMAAAEWVGMLRRMPPRLYSIASSLKAHPGEVHLTVAIARFQGRASERLGVFSAQCHGAARAGDRLPVFVQENPKFRLPENPDTPLIMIGPGSGVAPFRAFVEERGETGASGPAWLFFGERHFRTDFLYQSEWQQRLAEGSLSRLDVAFSRDREHKVYVQHRIRDRAREVYDWLQRGAHVYVCGDEKRMAPDVHAALVDVVRDQGGKSAADAEDYWMELQAENRYQRDVY